MKDFKLLTWKRPETISTIYLPCGKRTNLPLEDPKDHIVQLFNGVKVNLASIPLLSEIYLK